jgi:predicted ATPase
LAQTQWSDESSLTLINTILSSAKSPFIFVCTCRPVTKDHPFIQLVDDIEKTNNVSEISLRGLGIDEVHGMVCDLLRIDRASDLSSEHCWPLSDFLWQITNGSEFGCVMFTSHHLPYSFMR